MTTQTAKKEANNAVGDIDGQIALNEQIPPTMYHWNIIMKTIAVGQASKRANKITIGSAVYQNIGTQHNESLLMIPASVGHN